LGRANVREDSSRVEGTEILKPISEHIEQALRSFPTTQDTADIFRFLADILRARRDEFDASWHMSGNTEEIWKALRARRLQLTEDLEVIAAIHGIVNGNPYVKKAPSRREKPTVGYGEL
jgi:hypothetical protein